MGRSSKSPHNLSSIPFEVLENIISYLSPWQGRRLRQTCKPIKSAYDSLVLHKFKVTRNVSRGSKKFSLLESVKKATHVYRKKGHFPVFLDQLEKLSEENLNPQLDTYFAKVDQSFSLLTLDARFSFVLSILNLLRENKWAKMTTEAGSEWNRTFTVPGWIALYRNKASPPFWYPLGKNGVLIMLTKLLHASLTGEAFVDSTLFINYMLRFGFSGPEEVQKEVMQLTLTVSGKHCGQACHYFDALLTRGRLARTLKDDFRAVLTISCLTAKNFGCPTEIQYVIGKASMNEVLDEIHKSI